MIIYVALQLSVGKEDVFHAGQSESWFTQKQIDTEKSLNLQIICYHLSAFHFTSLPLNYTKGISANNKSSKLLTFVNLIRIMYRNCKPYTCIAT